MMRDEFFCACSSLLGLRLTCQWFIQPWGHFFRHFQTSAISLSIDCTFCPVWLSSSQIHSMKSFVISFWWDDRFSFSISFISRKIL